MSAPSAIEHSPPPAPAAPPPSVDAPAAPKGGSSYTVWSSTPGDGQHFDPKD
jgi:hypothetical protein